MTSITSGLGVQTYNRSMADAGLPFRAAVELVMRSPYGLAVIEDCASCPQHSEHLFCNLPVAALRELEKIKSTAAYPEGALLFVQGQPARGIFVLCSGKAKLYTSAADGRSIIMKIAEPGDLLGLGATLNNKPYEATVEILEPSQASFIPRQPFLDFLRGHSDAAMRIARQMSEHCQRAYTEIRCLGLSHSASEKLAKLLLDWSAKPSAVLDGLTGESRLRVTLTHEEIAQMIGSSRETVTRLFADFKRKRLIHMKGSSLVIRNRQGLERIVSM